MRIKRVINLLSGLLGLAFLVFALTRVNLSEAFFRANWTLTFTGIFGIILIITATWIDIKLFQKQETKKK